MAKKLSPKVARTKIAAAERASRAVELYTQGWSFRRIAIELGYAGPSGVHKAVKAAIRSIPSRAVNELRVEVDERSRVMLEQLMPVVVDANKTNDARMAAMDRVLRVDKQLRELHGLDAPAASVQLNAEMPSKDVRQELLDRLARLAETAAASEDPQPA